MNGWWLTYVSSMEGARGRRVVAFDTWEAAIRSALNLVAHRLAATKPVVRSGRPQ